MKRTMWEIGSFLKRRAAAGGQSETNEDGTELSAEDAKTQTRQQVDALTAQAAATASRTLRQVRVLLKRARRRAARYCKTTRQRVARTCLKLKLWADLTQRALDQAHLRLAGQRSIPNRMVSLHDPDARPIRRGKLSVEGCISYGKRRFGLKRSRLRRLRGVSIWTGWGVFAHNLTKVPGLVKARADRAAAKLSRATQKRRHQETLDSLTRSRIRAQLEACA